MSRRHWFLPDNPDVLGLLRGQVAITIEGLDGFARWASGDEAAGKLVYDAKERGDTAKRALLAALRSALITPLEPEDVFALSRGADHILTSSRNVITESRVLACAPDAGVAEMARLIAEGMVHIDAAVAQLSEDVDRATAAADAAIDSTRQLEDVYGRGMAGLLDVDERSARIGGRELYRRCSRIADLVEDLAEHVVYTIVKQT